MKLQLVKGLLLLGMVCTISGEPEKSQSEQAKSGWRSYLKTENFWGSPATAPEEAAGTEKKSKIAAIEAELASAKREVAKYTLMSWWNAFGKDRWWVEGGTIDEEVAQAERLRTELLKKEAELKVAQKKLELEQATYELEQSNGKSWWRSLGKDRWYADTGKSIEKLELEVKTKEQEVQAAIGMFNKAFERAKETAKKSDTDGGKKVEQSRAAAIEPSRTTESTKRAIEIEPSRAAGIERAQEKKRARFRDAQRKYHSKMMQKS